MPYIGNQPFGKTVRTITSETLTTVKTVFSPTGGYTVGYVDVYLNGVRLTEGDDFTATNGTTVTLQFNPLISDTVDIVSYGTVEMANAVRREGDTLTGTLNTQALVPTANLTYDIGTSTMRYRDLYLSGNTIYVGDAVLNANGTSFSVANSTGGVYTSALGNTTITGTANVSTGINVGANVNLTTSRVNVGNSTVNTALTSTAFSISGENVSAQIGMRNRIINGDMRIAQRTAGAVTSVANSRGAGFAIDRWSVWLANWAGGSATQQQSTDVPSGQGFVNSLLVTVTSASSTPDPTSGRFLIHQMIEGFNVADLNWGTASAKSVTVSFWVKSSVTGNYGFTLTNSASNRGYVISYTINSANTWEQKTVTIPGDTSGTWTTDNTAGITLNYDLGVNGPTTDTVNTWLTGDYRGLTSGVNLINTLNATFYITGVQLEVGTVATPFERRPYGTELSLCQRYYWQLSSSGKGGYTNGIIYQGWADTTTNSIGILQLPVTMRTSPTLSTSGTIGDYVFRAPQTQGISPACATVPTLGTDGTNYVRIGATTSNTFTVGAGHYFSFSGSTAGYIGLSAEL